MTEILRPDFCVIGGGPGGMAAARRAAALGAEVVLVEKRPLGTVEPVRGAVQAELLAAAAHTTGPRSARLGGHEAETGLDFRRLCQEADSLLVRYARDESPARLAGLKIKVVQAAGSFTNRSCFEAGETAIEARQFLLAIGSRATPPAIAGLELVRLLRPEKIGDLILAPKHLAIIGARAEELMFVQAFLRLGAKATLFPVGGILTGEDSELTAPLLTVLQKEGLHISDRTEIAAIEPTAGGLGVKLTLTDGSVVDATHLVCSSERLPLVEGLGLKAARVAYDRAGIKVNDACRSTNPKIHAIQDDVESLRSMKSARADGEWVAQRLFGAGRPVRNVPAHIVPTDPEIAVVGLSEAEARKRYQKISVLRAAFSDNLRAEIVAHASRHPLAGHIKIIADVRNRVVGAGIVGPHARELIGYFGLAVAKELRVEDLTTFAANEPTLSEICQSAAVASMPHSSKVSVWQRLAARFSPR